MMAFFTLLADCFGIACRTLLNVLKACTPRLEYPVVEQNEAPRFVANRMQCVVFMEAFSLIKI